MPSRTRIPSLVSLPSLLDGGQVDHGANAATPQSRPLRARLAWLVGVVTLASGSMLPAAEPLLSPLELKNLSVEDLLAQNVVSLSRKPEAWSSAASDIFLLTDQAVWTTGATTLPQLLRLSPTLFVAQKSSAVWAVNARGFVRTNATSNKLLVMMDGRTVYSPLFSNVFWESTSTFLPDLDRIEVIGGPAGSTWGANAVNGVINIQSKSAYDTLGTLIFANSGTDQSGFGARYGTALPKGGAVRFYVQGSRTDASLSPTGTNDDLDPWRSLQTGFRADWGDEYSGALTIQGDWFAGRYQLGPDQDSDSDNGNLLVRWARSLSPTSHLWIRAYHDHTDFVKENDVRQVTRTSDLEFQHRWEFHDHQELIWGANYRAISDSIGDTVGFIILPPKLEFGLGSVFAQHQLNLAHNAVQVTTGLRLEHNHFSQWENQPSLRVAWTRARHTYWAAASRSTRIPSRLDTGFFAPHDAPYFIIGGPDFKSEVVQAYEVGWRGQPTRGMAVTTTAYFHDYDRLRSVEPDPATFFPIYEGNGVKGGSYGVETFVDWDVTSRWRVRGGGFFMHQTTRLSPGSADLEGGVGESSFPTYQALVRITYRPNARTSIWTSVRRIGEVPATESGGGVVPAYTELDATLTLKLNSATEISLSGLNLLSPSHPEIGGLADRREIARRFQAAVRWHY